MAFKTSKFATLAPTTESVVDLALTGATWPEFVTIMNRGPTGGMFEIAVALEAFHGVTSVGSVEGVTLPLAACPTAGTWLVPAVAGYLLQLPVPRQIPGTNLKVHLYSTGAAVVGIIAEGS